MMNLNHSQCIKYTVNKQTKIRIIIINIFSLILIYSTLKEMIWVFLVFY